jgi:hypothetical protein
VNLVQEVVKPRLNSEQYEQAVEQAKSLNLEIVVQELLGQFGGED